MQVIDESEHQFRKTKVYATVEDIERTETPELSPNLIHDCYQSCDHYLKTQFDLLREELIEPLVRDVKILKEMLSTNNDKQKNITKGYNQKKSLKERIETEIDSNVYFDIKLIEPFVNPRHGLILRFTFDYSSLESIDLTDCKRLMDGSLLCLSSDKFHKSIIFGIVFDSNINKIDPKTKKRLWNFGLKVDLNNNDCKELFEFVLKPKTTYTGIESLTYFEGMRHSLAKLKEINEKCFPLKRYIVDVKTDIRPPSYLKPETCFDMNCISKPKPREEGEECDQQKPKSDEKPNPLSSVKIVDKNCKSLLQESSTFDRKQLDAFYTALTKEFAVIQGPPGTGKTFVGLKIVKCLLDNQNVWNESYNSRPILIVCYKNHALDQFLEGIIKFNKNVVRIGGNSESEELVDYNLRSIGDKFKQVLKGKTEMEMPFDINNISELISANKKCGKIRNRIFGLGSSIIRSFEKIALSFHQILDFKEMEPFIKPTKICEQLATTGSINDETDRLYEWLRHDFDGDDIAFDRISEMRLTQKKLSNETFDEVIEISKKDIFDMNAREKWILYLYWREKLFDGHKKMIKVFSNTMNEEIAKLETKKAKFDRMLCQKTQIIGLTITGAAKHRQLVERFAPKIMIIEEAAEVLEGHIVAAISSQIEHLILIGDHKQLRPITNVRELTEKYFLDKSLFERMVMNGMPFEQLELQHRMRPCISQLLKVGGIYETLRNDQKVTKYPEMKYTFNKNMFFIDHNHIEDSNTNREVLDRSRSNLHEAKFVIELVKYLLLRQYPESSITVLTTYNAQLSQIKKLMAEESNKEFFIKEKKMDINSPLINGKEEKPEFKIRVSSVDGFQGEENDIIIISFVRSSKRGSIGFLDNMNRVNVGLSRARHALYCVGNFRIMAKESKMWAKIVEHLEENNYFDQKFTIGCKCSGEEHIQMPGQFELFNLQIRNGRCKCSVKQ